MEIIEHRLDSALHILSPNHDARPCTDDISLIVIHCISLPPGEYGGPWIEDLFTNRLDGLAHPYFSTICQLKVSAHVLIRRDGQMIQFVAFDRRAWHAGVSSYAGRTRCNDFSIGIELEGTDDTAYAEIQYVRLVELIRALLQNYPRLAPERITGHSDIAPGRKQDPGQYFDWKRLFATLAKAEA